MNEPTRRALVAVNRRFYSRFATSFSASRERPWPGWDRLLRMLRPTTSPRVLRVLDVGCGNGRFASYLAARLSDLDYLGIDGSPELLKLARERLGGMLARRTLKASWRQVELTGDELRRSLGDVRFDLVAVFGLLHHIPGRECRASLMTELATHVAPGGLLTAAIWRFDRLPRFASKVLPWDEYNRHATLPVDLAELEEGDRLLTWSGDRETPRYCHLVGEDEISTLSETIGLAETARFTGEGPGDTHNLYLTFRNLDLRSSC